jgi:exodeoxyribonuclease VII small subunit
MFDILGFVCVAPARGVGEVMPKPSSKKVEKAVEELTYEEALAELEEIVSALEGEQNQLDESIKLFERGQALAARCSVLLEEAELKVKQVAGDEVIPFEELSE